MFKFSLQRVLELRSKREQEAAVTLTSAREAADQARHECEELENAREHGVTRVAAARGGGVTVGQLQNFGLILQSMDERIATAREGVQSADAQVDRCMTDFTSASQERRLLDRLREKHQQAWQVEEVQQDRKVMDAIALTRFARQRDSANERP